VAPDVVDLATECAGGLPQRGWDGDDGLADQLDAEEEGEIDLDLDDDDRWLCVDCEGSSDGYRDMQAFIATLSDPSQDDRLEIAIRGKGAFRRFKDVLLRWPDELERWFAYSEERQRGRARAWLADAGYGPSPRFGSSQGR
jgi:hypothetical protein